MKCTYKKKTSSFEILENCFGGSFPSALKLETPPKLTVEIVEDSIIQRLIDFLSSKKQFKFMYNLALRQINSDILDEYSESKHLNLIKKCVTVIFPIIGGFLIFLKLIRSIITPLEIESYGHVSARRENTIIVVSNNIMKANLDINMIIGHENIHILQMDHGDVDLDKRLVEKERVKNYCELYDIKAHDHIKYLFDRAEVEARVHGLVSSFYISTGKLPLSRKEFLVCLLYSNDILSLLNKKLELFSLRAQLKPSLSEPKNTLELLAEIKEYAATMSITSPIAISTQLTSEFFEIICAINNSDEFFNFISFELPRYYSNVLRLYGSKSASSKLLAEINKERELYDSNYKRIKTGQGG